MKNTKVTLQELMVFMNKKLIFPTECALILFLLNRDTKVKAISSAAKINGVNGKSARTFSHFLQSTPSASTDKSSYVHIKGEADTEPGVHMVNFDRTANLVNGEVLF